MTTETEHLAAHQWYVTRWSGGGWGWGCSCPVVKAGTAEENPDRYVRHDDRESAARAAVTHVAEALDRLAEQGIPVPCDPDGIPVPPDDCPLSCAHGVPLVSTTDHPSIYCADCAETPVVVPASEWTDLPDGPTVWQSSGQPCVVTIEKPSARVFTLPAGVEWRVAM